jgi:hypothetical protein
MKRTRAVLFGCLCLAVFPSACLAWGADGHRIVAEIASKHLSPATQAWVQSLIFGQTLADASVWADEIKGARRSTAPWHYADIAADAKEFNLDRDCPKEGCVVSAIQRYCTVLRDERASVADRTEALKFLIHFVGDVHCPMHVANAHDKGGNDVAVEFFHNRTNLHRVWDTLLIERQKRNWRAYASQLEKAISDQDKKKLSACTNPAEWATQTHKATITCAYVIPKDGQLGQEYFDRCMPVMDGQLSTAGIRLATLLNSLFAECKGAPPTHPDKQPPATTAPAPEHQAGKFVGSRRSEVYHYPGCPIVGRISPDNLVSYDAAPAGKRLHQGCRP